MGPIHRKGAVEYRVAPLGKTMRPPVDVLLDWVRTYMPQIEEARESFDAR
ncbi:hypothetical protein ACFW88_36380 [Streptomyces anandii]|uniref:HTH hxlR-type domain-containing protein n=1 Tax=Streptomyces anandii TaxID=285454 RepID=A0ABW6HH15_9ACTN